MASAVTFAVRQLPPHGLFTQEGFVVMQIVAVSYCQCMDALVP